MFPKAVEGIDQERENVAIISRQPLVFFDFILLWEKFCTSSFIMTQKKKRKKKKNQVSMNTKTDKYNAGITQKFENIIAI